VPGWFGVAVSATIVLVATAIGLFWRARNGRFREIKAPTGEVEAIEPNLAALGVTTGVVTLLQFSTVFCAPCRATRVFCAEVATTVPGVRHVEIDAESHLDEVRALDVWRTPTVLVIDTTGAIRSRASGPTNRALLLAAVADVLTPAAAPPEQAEASREQAAASPERVAA
jgi:thiol-disulfide isomerase/thioredoxin